jgi:hypothetical protein
MLRCAPSRIHLTSFDVQDFEDRFVARQNARLMDANSSNIRLSPGPSRRPSLSLVNDESNAGRKRTVSTASRATFCSVEEVAVDDQLGNV